MKLRIILGFLILLTCYSFTQQTSKNKLLINISQVKHLGLNNDLQIENGSNQGITHTDTLGKEFNYRYNTSIITNAGTVPINFQIALSNEYDYPPSCDGGNYKIFLLPKELTPDTITLWNSIFDGLHTFLDRCLDNPYTLNKTLEPGEKDVVTIGRLFAEPATCGINLNALFVRGDSLFYVSTDRSVFIPCGQISYPE